MTPIGSDAFDAQQKWVEELEKRGEFQFEDPRLREKFYEYWTKGKELHGSSLIEDLSIAKRRFHPIDRAENNSVEGEGRRERNEH